MKLLFPGGFNLRLSFPENNFCNKDKGKRKRKNIIDNKIVPFIFPRTPANFIQPSANNFPKLGKINPTNPTPVPM